MKSLRMLVVEDEFISRKLLLAFLHPLGLCQAAKDATEALLAVELSFKENQPYDLICLDIKLPDLDGQETLKRIRALESGHGIMPGDGAKIIMTTAIEDPASIMQAFKGQCEAYLVKPIHEARLLEQIKKLGLMNP